jgi:hypothetical protein
MSDARTLLKQGLESGVFDDAPVFKKDVEDLLNKDKITLVICESLEWFIRRIPYHFDQDTITVYSTGAVVTHDGRVYRFVSSGKSLRGRHGDKSIVEFWGQEPEWYKKDPISQAEVKRIQVGF